MREITRDKLRQQFEEEYKNIPKSEFPMFLSVKYIHWLENKIIKTSCYECKHGKKNHNQRPCSICELGDRWEGKKNVFNKHERESR